MNHCYLLPRKIPILALVLFFTVWAKSSCAQVVFNDQNKSKGYFNVKFSGYLLFNGGGGISAAVGTWIAFKHLQPSFNMSFNTIFNQYNLGNRNRYLTKWQLNTVLSPMITVGGGTGALSQEIASFYFGSLGAVYANYQHSLTIGSNFVVMPRGIGRNLTTFRNRSQQLIYVGLRTGGKDWDINLNVFDDYLVFTDSGIFQGLADNFDRFYTGGGSLQLRYQNFKAKLHSEIYTGNFQRDIFDYPDLYMPYSSDTSSVANNWIGSKKIQRHPRYVSQEPGQKLFNKGRTFVAVEFNPFPSRTGTNTTVQAYFGFQGGDSNMKMQDWIHGLDKINKINTKFSDNPDSLASVTGVRERLHRFYPSSKEANFIWGAGLFINTIPTIPKI